MVSGLVVKFPAATHQVFSCSTRIIFNARNGVDTGRPAGSLGYSLSRAENLPKLAQSLGPGKGVNAAKDFPHPAVIHLLSITFGHIDTWEVDQLDIGRSGNRLQFTVPLVPVNHYNAACIVIP
jgi:hypothetical protein